MAKIGSYVWCGLTALYDRLARLIHSYPVPRVDLDWIVGLFVSRDCCFE